MSQLDYNPADPDVAGLRMRAFLGIFLFLVIVAVVAATIIYFGPWRHPLCGAPQLFERYWRRRHSQRNNALTSVGDSRRPIHVFGIFFVIFASSASASTNVPSSTRRATPCAARRSESAPPECRCGACRRIRARSSTEPSRSHRLPAHRLRLLEPSPMQPRSPTSAERRSCLRPAFLLDRATRSQADCCACRLEPTTIDLRSAPVDLSEQADQQFARARRHAARLLDHHRDIATFANSAAVPKWSASAMMRHADAPLTLHAFCATLPRGHSCLIDKRRKAQRCIVRVAATKVFNSTRGESLMSKRLIIWGAVFALTVSTAPGANGRNPAGFGQGICGERLGGHFHAPVHTDGPVANVVMPTVDPDDYPTTTLPTPPGGTNPRPNWYAPPAKIGDNLYFLGTRIHTTFALVSSRRRDHPHRRQIRIRDGG